MYKRNLLQMGDWIDCVILIKNYSEQILHYFWDNPRMIKFDKNVKKIISIVFFFIITN